MFEINTETKIKAETYGNERGRVMPQNWRALDFSAIRPKTSAASYWVKEIFFKAKKQWYLVASWVLVLGIASMVAVMAYKNQVVATAAQSGNSYQTVENAEPRVLGVSTIAEQPAVPDPVGPRKVSDPKLENIGAESFLVYDSETGKVLLEKNADQKLSVGSLTKLLTALVAYENMDLSSDATITPADILKVSPSLRLVPGDRVKLLDVFNAMIVGSANDAALALSHIYQAQTGKSFVDAMNAKAKQLEMADSHFSNPMGFDSQYNYSTAKDLQKLSQVTQQLGVFKNLGRQTSYAFSGSLGYTYKVATTNKLLKKYANIEAVKTGTTPNTGEAMITKITQKDNSIVVIVLSSKDREGDTLKLSDAAFSSFGW